MFPPRVPADSRAGRGRTAVADAARGVVASVGLPEPDEHDDRVARRRRFLPQTRQGEHDLYFVLSFSIPSVVDFTVPRSVDFTVQRIGVKRIG